MNKKWVWVLIAVLFFSFSSLVFAAQSVSNAQQACADALYECKTQASKLYPYDGGIINPMNPSQNHQAYLGAQKICDYLYSQCLSGKPINPFTIMNGFDQAAMNALTNVFNAQITGQGSNGIGNTYLSCMQNVGDHAYCAALFPTTVPGRSPSSSKKLSKILIQKKNIPFKKPCS